MRTRRRRREPWPTTVEEFEDSTRRSLAGTTSEGEIGRGLLEGFQDSGLTRARPRPGEGSRHYGCYLIGCCLRSLLTAGYWVDRDNHQVVCRYLRALAGPRGQQLLEDDGFQRAHAYAAAEAEELSGHPMRVDLERRLVDWVGQLVGKRLGADGDDVLARNRERRHARLFPAPSPNGDAG